MNWLIDKLFYIGLGRKNYDLVKDEILEDNRKNMMVFSSLVAAAMAIMALVSVFYTNLADQRLGYIWVVAVSLCLYAICAKPARRYPILTMISMYVFSGALFLLGIAMGTYITPEEETVSFLIFLFVVPLLFTDRPIRMNLAILISLGVYIPLAYVTQPWKIFGYNMTNILPYGIVSMVVSTYMMHIKAMRFLLEQKNKYLSESDQLTGLYNRRSYDDHIQRLRDFGRGRYMKICAFDVNGLKVVNDTLGHQAGDELIRGAADCIEGVFGRYGVCYRVGGDEYMAILEGYSPKEEELIRMLSARTAGWKGNLVSGLSISVGIVEDDGTMTLDELMHEADLRMYAYKEDFYNRNGGNRRYLCK